MRKIASESSDNVPVPQLQQADSSSGSAAHASHGSVPQCVATRSPRMQHNFVPPSGIPVMQPDPLASHAQSNENFYLQALQQTIQNSNAVTEAILAGVGLGGGSCVGVGFQPLMQFYSSVAGDGEQENVLHALMNGVGGSGGGGRIDVAQSILSANESLDRLGGIK
ncbi:hypothetical protein F511_24027 [Dorcoceras hygrometricum]|uniref:Uncharacterized protein n=1 Tax=Dorcoceras hygrometricum TaxID=472368 RepID=A0A2Z7AQ77_9LAMI|nr:hypothetical protein F511_24027 [Dorcoceras hygrometricum]